jgi:hypothetical protein
MAEPIQETQGARQGLGGPDGAPPPQGFYTAYEMELSRRVSELAVGQKNFVLKSDLSAMATTIVAEIKAEFKTELKTELNAVKTEFKTEINAVKTEINAVKTELKTELKTEINAVKTEFKTELNVVETKLLAEISGVKERLNSVDKCFDNVYKCFDNVDKRFDSADKRNSQTALFTTLIGAALFILLGFVLNIHGNLSELTGMLRPAQETRAQVAAPQAFPTPGVTPALPNAVATPAQTPSAP